VMSESNIKWVAAALLCTTLVSGAAALYLNGRVNALEAEYQRTLGELERFTVTVNILIDYGNGTSVWYNDTRVAVGESMLEATEQVADVDYSVTEYGAFINGVNGVSGELNRYWIWSYYDGGWQYGPVGADQWRLHSGDKVAWVYTEFS
jgi:hypothetical protein